MDGALLAGIGTLIAGVAAVASLVVSGFARREAREAKETSSQAMYEGLHTEVRELMGAHTEAAGRWQREREGMEEALRSERARADGAELVAFKLQASLAELRIDFASSRAEVAELRQRFEAVIAGQHAGGA